VFLQTRPPQVCSDSALLVAKFGRRRRSGIASDRRAGGIGRCDHEPKTEAHRILKTALRRVFEVALLATMICVTERPSTSKSTFG
jgi:hypothetical protein